MMGIISSIGTAVAMLVPIGRCLVLIFSVCGNGLCHEKDEEWQQLLGALGTPKTLQ